MFLSVTTHATSDQLHHYSKYQSMLMTIMRKDILYFSSFVYYVECHNDVFVKEGGSVKYPSNFQNANHSYLRVHKYLNYSFIRRK